MTNDRSYAFLRFVGWLISPRLTCICLALLMALTFCGTLYQVDHGLHAAQVRFYDSYFLLLGGFLPFPGTQTVMAVLLVNLLGYLIKTLILYRIRVGILMTHLGILMLLIGGAITHHFAEESHLTLQEGETSSVSASYGEWELALWMQEGPMRDVLAHDADNLKPGQTLAFPNTDVRVTVESYFQNARAFRAPMENPPLNTRSITKLEPTAISREQESNLAGGIFTVQAGDSAPQRVLLYGEDTFPIGKSTLALRHRRYPLPLAVTLEDFERDFHPGTQMAKWYSSRVAIVGEGVQREVTISMNKPLRHREYTFYQASYAEEPTGWQSSTLAVARNYGRLVPYVATSIVALGMMVHFISAMLQRRKRSSP